MGLSKQLLLDRIALVTLAIKTKYPRPKLIPFPLNRLLCLIRSCDLRSANSLCIRSRLVCKSFVKRWMSAIESFLLGVPSWFTYNGAKIASSFELGFIPVKICIGANCVKLRMLWFIASCTKGRVSTHLSLFKRISLQIYLSTFLKSFTIRSILPLIHGV